MNNSNSSAQRQALAHAGENPAPETDASGVLSEASCCASSSEGVSVIAHLSDRNVEVLRHECYSGAMVTEYRTTDGKRPDPDSVAVRSGIVDLKSDEEWYELQSRRQDSREQSKAQTSSQGVDEHKELLKSLNLRKIPCCHPAPLG